MKKRKAISNEISREIWEREKGICENCKKQLFEVIELRKLRIKVYDEHTCYSCGELGNVLTLDVEGCGIMWLDDNRIGELVRRKYPFFYPSKYSKDVYYANHCEYCDKLQGDWHIMDDFLIHEHDGLKEPINVEIIELPFVFDSYIEDLPYHIHHIDKNPDNNSPDNLMLLCPKCHREIHKT